MGHAQTEERSDTGGFPAVGAQHAGHGREVPHETSGLSCARQDLRHARLSRQELCHGQANASGARGVWHGGTGSLPSLLRRVGTAGSDQRATGRGQQENAGRRVAASLAKCRTTKDALNHFTATGCVKAPFPAESQAAKRTHFFPAASNGMVKRLAPNCGKSAARMILRSVVWPSPHTSSTNSRGKV